MPPRFTPRPSGIASAALAATVAVLMLSGCSSPPKSEIKESSSGSASPESWSLPLQAYMPTIEEMSQLAQAKKILISDCMEGLGLAWTPAPDLPRIGPKTLTDWRYGIHDEGLAAARGYKADAAEQEAYDAAVEKGAVDGSTENSMDARALEGRIEKVNGREVPAAWVCRRGEQADRRGRGTGSHRPRPCQRGLRHIAARSRSGSGVRGLVGMHEARRVRLQGTSQRER